MIRRADTSHWVRGALLSETLGSYYIDMRPALVH